MSSVMHQHSRPLPRVNLSVDLSRDPVPVASRRQRSQRDDRNVARRRLGPETMRRRPATNLGQVQIHQDEIGSFADRHRDRDHPGL